MLRKFPVPRVAESFTIKNQHRKSILKEAEWHFYLGRGRPTSCFCLQLELSTCWQDITFYILLNKESTVDLRPRLLREHAPYRASWEMLFLARTTEVHIVVLLTHLWLWACYIIIYTEREWGSTKYYFIDNKMMHLQYSAFGGKARWCCTLSIYRTRHWRVYCQGDKGALKEPQDAILPMRGEVLEELTAATEEF